MAKLLSQSRKPVLLLGAQTVMDPAATARLVAAVEAIGAPVWLSSCARGLLGAQHALQYRHCRGEALKASDCIVLAGVSMDFRLGYGMSIPYGASLWHGQVRLSPARGRRKTTLISLNLDKVDLYKVRALRDRARHVCCLVVLSKPNAESHTDSSHSVRPRRRTYAGGRRAGGTRHGAGPRPLARMAQRSARA